MPVEKTVEERIEQDLQRGMFYKVCSNESEFKNYVFNAISEVKSQVRKDVVEEVENVILKQYPGRASLDKNSPVWIERDVLIKDLEGITLINNMTVEKFNTYSAFRYSDFHYPTALNGEQIVNYRDKMMKGIISEVKQQVRREVLNDVYNVLLEEKGIDNRLEIIGKIKSKGITLKN